MTDAWDSAQPDTPATVAESPKDAWDAASPGASSTPVTTSNLGIAGNIGMGAIKGASDIGATILSPVDYALHAMNASNMSPAERRKSLNDFFQEHANPASLPFKAGAVGAQIAGTAGVGGALGAGAEAAGAAPELVSALSSAGMAPGATGSLLGNAALKAGAGAVVGGASAGLVNPSLSGSGAAIGAVVPGAAWLAGLSGKLGSGVLGATTGTGQAAVDAAYKAGQSGDRSFIDNMRGNASFADIVDQAKGALSNMRDARSDAYRSGMAAVSGDKTVLDVEPIRNAVQAAQDKFGSFHGQVVNENANAALQKVADKVNDWAFQDPKVFHTPEGLDKLKQWVGGELENAKPGTQTDAALKGIYNTVKSTIVQQAPTYAKTMSDYESASEQLSEISRTLSLNPKASVDTSVRKLQSILRNNVTTNFGNRAGAVDALENQGGANLRSALAGQSMSSVWPRGIAGAVDAAGAIPLALHNPLLLGAGLAASPRLVGEGAYGLGKLSNFVNLNKLAPVAGAQSLNDLLGLNK